MKSKYIYDYILEYNKQNIYPFNMPGHKKNFKFFDNINLLDYDVTEFGEMDNLHNPNGIIKNSETLAAKLFGSHKSFFLTNGSSAGNLIALMTTCKEGDKIIISRNSHKSIFNGLTLSGAYPLYVYPMETEEGFIASVNPNDIEKLFLEHNNIKAVFLTSPTYEGFTSDINSISKITKKHNAILIVDEAHGAHFNLSNDFPESATKYADIVIQSLHKTLPTIGQSSILHINNRIDEEKILFYRSIFNTTSPSYIMMSLMDYCINYFYNNENYYSHYIETLKSYRDKLNKNNIIKLINKSNTNRNTVFDLDISKLVFFINSNSISGFELESILANDYKIQVELSSHKHIVALSSICDTKDGFEKLLHSINNLENKLDYDDKNIYDENLLNYKGKLILTPKEAASKNTKKISFKSSEGNISGEFIVPYPPGIPLLVPGELITKEIIDSSLNFIKKGGNFIGANDKNLGFINIITED